MINTTFFSTGKLARAIQISWSFWSYPIIMRYQGLDFDSFSLTLFFHLLLSAKMRLKNNFDYGAFSLVRTDEIIEYNTQMQPYIGRSDGSAGYFQLGMVDPSAAGFVSELRDDTGFGLLWGILSSLVSRILALCPTLVLSIGKLLNGHSGYLKGSQDVGLNYTNRWTEREKIKGYADSDFAGDQDTMKSQTGYVFTLYGNTISWKANLQPILALSITESEYVAATEAFKEALWIKGIMEELEGKQTEAVIWCDGQESYTP